MNVLVEIDGREAIPVRAIPYVTNWALDPLSLARELARSDQRTHVATSDAPADWVQVWNLLAYTASGEMETPREIRPIEWEPIATKLEALSNTIRAEERHQDALLQAWRDKSVQSLPSGVFVWKDELLAAWESVTQYIAPPIAGDTTLTYSPLLPPGDGVILMEGFETSNHEALRARQSLMAMMLANRATPEHQRDEVEAEAVLKRLDDAKANLTMMTEALANAPKTGDVGKIRAAQSAVDEAKQDVEKAQATIERLRGDDPFKDARDSHDPDVEQEQVIDRKALATPDQLITVFGGFGLKASQFKKLQGPLKRAQKEPGKIGRGGWPGLFCPYDVMMWLAKGKRYSMSERKGWDLLKRNFPDAYAKFSIGDPDA